MYPRKSTFQTVKSCLAILCLVQIPRISCKQSVYINLFSSWSQTPLHLEASEFLATEKSEYFWDYVDEFKNETAFLDSLDYAQQYERIIEIASKVVNNTELIVQLKFALAQRVYSPAIVAHQSLSSRGQQSSIVQSAYLELPKLVKADDSFNTTVSDAWEAEQFIDKLVKQAASYAKDFYLPTVYKSDHVYYAHKIKKDKFSKPTIILYGEIGTNTFNDLYKLCKSKADDGDINFIVRHLVASGEKANVGNVYLGGYGVELAIKSTEYKAQDDTRIKGDDSNPFFDSVTDGDKNSSDIVLTLPTFNETELSDLSTQAVELILSQDEENRLSFLQDLNQNFPIQVKNLVNRTVSRKVRDELELNQLIFARYLSLSPSDAALFMNGLYFDIDALDLFAFFDVVKSEYKELLDGNAETESDVERFLNKHYKDKYTKFYIEPKDPEKPHLLIQVITDPLTRGAQKIIPILQVIRKIFNIKIRFMFNCLDKHTEMPLKNFYRFVIDDEPNFRDGRNNPPAQRAIFRNLPVNSLLTLNLATPENWLVGSVRSPYDLDNIHLAEIPDNHISADFKLEHLLLEGHCFDITNGSPPRGLQFILGTQNQPAIYDTIVMANLGYFQLKASPGSWSLRLRPGKSAEIYTVFDVDGADFILYQDKRLLSNLITPILLNDFRSRFVKLKVHKKRDQRHRDLLTDDNTEEKNGDIWESIRNTVWSNPEDAAKAASTEQIATQSQSDKSVTRTSEKDRINIFSLASGHLYERLARIMMLSVLKHTNTPVKFWFLKNYLSPTFKDFLPYMAEKYNFDYEFVQYKWPRWLHQQTEKQRIIWGYKILFLDVLFPLDVRKIIFVDADQVVRTDLKELRDFDLNGAPYGYTPFCESRTDMDGYRFWKSGYWRNHLHGRKYHISALYVVDLVKFRKIAAGDRLRGQYQGLSQDPNSLSNLDQDLPNNMIHQVAIKSLPQEWLWCETWCSNEEKEKAKTIDLCNNPQTKEPKLVAARRIVKEWQDYDDEIRAIYNEFENSKVSRKSSKSPNQHQQQQQQAVVANNIATNQDVIKQVSSIDVSENEINVDANVSNEKLELKATKTQSKSEKNIDKHDEL